MTNEIKTGAKLGTKVGEAVVYVVFKFGSFAYCGVDLYEGLTMEECVALRGNGDIESYCEKDGLEWHNVECSVDAVRGKLLDLRTNAEQTEATIPESELDEAVCEDVQKELDAERERVEAEQKAKAEAEQKAKTKANVAKLVEKTRWYISVFEAGRSAWDKGVRVYADELLDELLEAIRGGWVDLEDMASEKLVDRALLNGAANWKEYSWGGCSLIYDGDIAERLCTPSELKKTRHGERRPNGREEWLDVQARALRQAAGRVRRGIRYAIRTILEEEVA